MHLKILSLLNIFAAVVAAQAVPLNQSFDLFAEAATHPALSLEQFQRWALALSPALQQAAAGTAQAAGEARQAGLFPNPSIGYQGEQIRGGSYGGGEQGGFIQQTFPLGGKLGLRRNIYEQARRANQIAESEERSRVLSSVGQGFYSALAAQATVNARRRLLALANDAEVTARQLANVGQADAPDVLQAEVEAEQAQLDLAAAQQVFLAEFRSLAALAGKPEAPVSLLEGDLENPPQLDADRVLDQILRESPAIRRAQQDAVRAEAALASAHRENIPDLEVHAGLQQNFEPLASGHRNTVGLQGFATAGINLPLFDRNQGKIAAAAAALTSARAEVTRVRLSLGASLQPLVQEYLTSRVQAAQYKNAMIPRAERAYRLYLANYEQMAGAYPQVLVSQRTLFQLQIAQIDALRTQWIAAVALQNFGLGMQ